MLSKDVPQTCLKEMKSVGKKVKRENSTIVTKVALEESIKSVFHLITLAVIKDITCISLCAAIHRELSFKEDVKEGK